MASLTIVFAVLDIEAIHHPTYKEIWRSRNPEQVNKGDFAPTWVWQPVSIGLIAFSVNMDDPNDTVLLKFGAYLRSTNTDDRAIVKKTLSDMSDLLQYTAGGNPYNFSLITSAGRKYDIPVLACRAFEFGISIPWYYRSNNRFRNRYFDGHFDAADQLSEYGAGSPVPVDTMAQMIGLPGKKFGSGADVQALWDAKDLTTIRDYNLTDCIQEMFIGLRMHYLQDKITGDQYSTIVKKLLEQIDTVVANQSSTIVKACMDAIDRTRLLAVQL
jgi:hypothetical protein